MLGNLAAWFVQDPVVPDSNKMMLNKTEAKLNKTEAKLMRENDHFALTALHDWFSCGARTACWCYMIIIMVVM